MAITPSIRKMILNLHLWAGVAAAIFLLLIGGSGALLVFETQIDQALNSKLARVAPNGVALSLAELKIDLERQYPGYHILEFGISENNDTAYEAYVQPPSGDGLDIGVNQYTGKALGVWDGNRLMRKVHSFHTHLLAGKTGSTIVACSAIFLLFLSISGLILWWRAKVFRFNLRSSGPKLQYDLHSTIGVLASVFLFVFSVTGVVVHWEDTAGRWARQASHLPVDAPSPHPETPTPGAVPLDPTQVLAFAQAAVPGARPTTVALSDNAADPALVIFKYPEDHTPAGRTRVLLDAHTGKILSLTNSRAAPVAIAYVTRLNREIHTGDVGGWPTRILASIASSCLPLLAVTGPLLWWQRRQVGKS